VNSDVREAALALVARAVASGHYKPPPPDIDEPVPATASADEVAALQNDLGGCLPAWYIELLTTIPLCGLAFEYASKNGDGGSHFIEWLGPARIRSESLEAWPGVPLLPRGYVCVAGIDGGGDGLFFSVEEGDNPPLYHILHDGGDDAETLLAKGEKLVPSLSALLRDATVTERL